MTITPYGWLATAAGRSVASFGTLKSDLADLQAQLATGRKADSYAGLGAAGAHVSLTARQTLAATAGVQANVKDGLLRIGLLDTGLTQLAKLAAGLRTSLPDSYSASPVGQTNAQVSAEDGLRQVIDILNTNVDGRYLYSGRAADTRPVATYETILDGEGGRAGLKQLVAERKAADLGASGSGRLTLAAAGTNVSLSEEAAGLPFGLKLASATATGSGIAAALSAGPPKSAGLTVAAQPLAGDAVTIGLTLPDGSHGESTLTARSAGAPAGPGTFTIGATTAETAANLAAALGSALQGFAGTTLASASTARAAADFFAGSATSPPPRVAGPPYATATATVPGTAANTLIWYAGETGAGSARETASVRTGEGAAVGVGARANEPAFQALLAGLAALAAETFPPADATSQARYQALTERISTAPLDQGLVEVSADMAGAKTALSQAGARLGQREAQLTDLLADTENADPNEVATKLLAVQTRLQASYQTTAILAKLSLVNFL